MEGPLFENDGSDQHMHALLYRVRQAMEEGVVLVLINLEMLYESLYDVLNQSYDHVGSVMYSRIVVGRHSESCIVHPNFKVCLNKSNDNYKYHVQIFF